MESFLQALRAANMERDKEWSGGVTLTVEFRANELAGEAGEACNILKKLDRQRLGLRGSCATLGALQEELADVVICADLLAMHYDVALVGPAWGHWQQVTTDHSLAGVRLMARVGRCCSAVAGVYPASMVAVLLGEVIRHVKKTADEMGLDLARCVTTKFNMTSEKQGFKTRLVV